MASRESGLLPLAAGPWPRAPVDIPQLGHQHLVPVGLGGKLGNLGRVWPRDPGGATPAYAQLLRPTEADEALAVRLVHATPQLYQMRPEAMQAGASHCLWIETSYHDAPEVVFANRAEAGKLLAQALRDLEGSDAVVLGVPRGGVVVADEIARALGLPLHAFLVRKIGAPGNPELAVGAAASDGTILIDVEMAREIGATSEYLLQAAAKVKAELQRRMERYGPEASPPDVAGCTVVLVDDGAATGATLLTGLRSLRSRQPASLVVALPVAPPNCVSRLWQAADRVVCLSTPTPFFAVGVFFREWEQVSDDQISQIFHSYRTSQSSDPERRCSAE